MRNNEKKDHDVGGINQSSTSPQYCLLFFFLHLFQSLFIPLFSLDFFFFYCGAPTGKTTVRGKTESDKYSEEK